MAAGRCRASGNSAAADVVTNVVHSNARRPKRLFHEVNEKEKDDEMKKITTGSHECNDSDDEAETYIRRCIRHGCRYNDDDDVLMGTARGMQEEGTARQFQSDLEMTSDEDCPRVQARRRQAMRNRLLGLDLYRPDGDKECSKDTDDEDEEDD